MELSLLQLFTMAQTCPPAAASGSAGNPFGSLLIMVPLFGLMYFLFIRPQKKKQQQVMEMLKTLKAGDKVMTSSGALGVISKVTDKTVRILFADKVEIEFVRSAVAEIITEPTAEQTASK
ncbi:MAG: preprotein translocase subunit YajC [Lentisphaeria bacterium]